MWWIRIKTDLWKWIKRAGLYIKVVLPKLIRFAKSSRWLPGALISFAVALVIVVSVDWPALAPLIDRPGWWILLATVFFYFNAIFCRAAILRVLLSERVDYARSLVNLSEGYLINILMPLRLGDNGRAFILARKLGLSEYEIRSAIRVERLYDAFIVAGLLIISLLVSTINRDLKIFIFGILFLLVILLLSLPRIAKRLNQSATSMEKNLESFPWISQAIQNKALSLFVGMNVLTDSNLFASSLFWSALAWVFRIAGLFTLIKGVSPYAPFGYGIFVAAVLAISLRIPSGPASVGLYEGAIILALYLLNVDPTTALACALMSHLIDIIQSLLLGSPVFILEGESLTGLYKKLTGF